MTKPTVSVPRRLIRLVRLGIHALRAWWILHVHFPRIDDPARDAHVQRWSTKLLRILGVRTRVIDSPTCFDGSYVVVGNHVSWLDIFLIYTERPGLFVAKAEIREWPLIGRLIEKVGTLFIERGSARHARKTNTAIVDTISGGRVICLFPEGSTTEGHEMLPFHAALFQPAIEARATLLPVALRYVHSDGSLCKAASYEGDKSLQRSVWDIVSQRDLHAELHFLEGVTTAEQHRRDLARKTEAIIAERLGVPVKRRRNEIPDDLPDESR